MPKSPITQAHVPISKEAQQANEAILANLFTPEFNEDRAKFNQLPGRKITRDGNKDEKFQTAVATHADSLGIDPVAVTLSPAQYIDILSTELSKNNIILAKEVLEDNTEAREQRRALFPYFSAILTIEAYNRDTRVIVASNVIDENNKTYASETNKRSVAANQEIIRAFFQKIHVNERLVKTKAPGNGNCFYHSVMLNIIYGALSGDIKEKSQTAKKIKANLLPHIAHQLESKEGTKLNFSGRSLKQSILLLLRSAPLSGVPEMSSSDNNEIRAIEQCDLYHLLTDVCAPAMREAMQDGVKNNIDLIKAATKDVVEKEFISFITGWYGEKELKFANNAKEKDIKSNYSNDAIKAAKNHFDSGEFSDIPDEYRQAILSKWKKVYKKSRKHTDFPTVVKSSDDKEKTTFINHLFEEHWNKEQENIFNLYLRLHTEPKVMAGRPQQLALSQQLHCNVNLVSRHDGRISPVTEPLDNAYSVLLENSPGHYDAMLGNLHTFPPSAIAMALHECMQDGYQHPKKLSETPDELSQIDTLEGKSDKAENESKPLETNSTIIVIQKIKEDVEDKNKQTKRLIQQFEKKKLIDIKKIESQSKAIIAAAKKGYADAYFFHAADGKKLPPGSTITDKIKQEAKDLTLAIQLQNEEIEDFFRKLK